MKGDENALKPGYGYSWKTVNLLKTYWGVHLKWVNFTVYKL